MRIFEPHAHMTSRTTDDYEAMAAAGVRAIVEPAFWLGQPRTHVGTFLDYFDGLLGFERFRAGQYGIKHFCTMGLNPKEANDDHVRDGVIEALPRYLEKDGVVAVGEIGFDSMTPAEEDVFVAHLDLAREHDLPALVHTPHRDKLAGTRRTMEIVGESGLPPERVLVDHNNELTVGEVIDSGCFVGFSIYPNTKMDEDRMVRILQEQGTDRIILNSACDWGQSDPLKVRKTADAMLAAGFTEDDVDKVVWRNPVAFFSQSGRLELDEETTAADPTATYAGNSLLRGGHAKA